MGVEEYSATLQPSENAVEKQFVEQTLSQIGFVADDPTTNADLLFNNETTFTYDNGEHIIEALIKWYESNNLILIKYINIRFAICQPVGVVKTFFEVLTTLSSRHEIQLKNNYANEMYGLGCFDEFKPKVNQQVIAMKERWQQMFGGDTEEPKIAVNQVWSYFKKKHPNW